MAPRHSVARDGELVRRAADAPAPVRRGDMRPDGFGDVADIVQRS